MSTLFSIIREPDDKLASARICLGHAPGVGSYIVFRGDVNAALALLRESLTVAEAALPAGEYNDKRGRPQG